MEDEQIIALYWARQETAIAETSGKYGSYCIQFNIIIHTVGIGSNNDDIAFFGERTVFADFKHRFI